ncbi:MAG: class I SAM-dependent methyltransferase [Chloroflexi bacterium]|nr:class I SAM-dependent methyltransferase [Chloroflexota bacterium]
MRARERDQWAQWLLHRRHGGDPEQLRQTLAYLRPIRDRGLDRCRFVLTGAADLAVIPVGSDDAVTTRSVLIHVVNTPRAFAELVRVLRPHGRLSLFPLTNRLSARCTSWDAGPIEDLRDRVRAVIEVVQPLAADPMLDFDDRDLLTFAEGAGFGEIHRAYQADIELAEPRRWETASHSSGNPRVPTWAEVIEQVLSPEEAARHEAHLRPVVERGKG